MTQPRTILFASTNPGKQTEVSRTLAVFGVQLLDPSKLYGQKGRPPQVEENGSSYAENAALKARAWHEWSGQPTLADDSGLEVEALNYGPGIHTARFAGPDASDADNRCRLLLDLGSCENRLAQYRCSLHMISETGEVDTAEALFMGSISHQERGAGGFGYDPLFIPAGESRTLAELKEAGHQIKTHRILALEKLFSLKI